MLTTIILAGTTSLFFGFSDFFGGVASRADNEVSVTAAAHVTGLVLLTIALLIFPAQAVTRSDILYGMATGVCSAIGVTCLYGALARGRMSVVAPITAALSGCVPAAYDFATGTALRPVALAGLGLALVAIIIVSSVGHPEDRAGMPPIAIGLSLVSGLAFAGGFIFLSMTGKAAGIAPLVVVRLVSVVLLAALALIRGRGKYTLVRKAWLPAIGAGALDVAATTAMLFAIRSGPLSVASVLGSLYPVATILLARFVLKERLHWAQRVGVALALVAVIMAALG
jgi:drug/metabolite transporter (DMT)-like permease